MRISRLLLATMGVPALLCSVNCSDPGSPSGGASGGATGGANQTTGGTSAGANPQAGSAGDGGTNAGGSAGSAAGAAGSAGSAAGAAGSAMGGAGGSAAGRIVTARDDFCTPRCALSNGYCALKDVGCNGPGPCLLQAQCIPFEDCDPMAKPSQGCGPGGGVCVNDPLDDCPLGMAGCRFECICTETVTCAAGTSFDNDPAVCGCVPIVAPAKDCNVVDCPADFVCKAVLGSPACVKPFAQ